MSLVNVIQAIFAWSVSKYIKTEASNLLNMEAAKFLVGGSNIFCFSKCYIINIRGLLEIDLLTLSTYGYWVKITPFY